jgi:hypothetical protein
MLGRNRQPGDEYARAATVRERIAFILFSFLVITIALVIAF